jgi:hypothetical protein
MKSNNKSKKCNNNSKKCNNNSKKCNNNSKKCNNKSKNKGKKQRGGSRTSTPLPIEIALDLAFENAKRKIQLNNNISFDDALERMLNIISMQYEIPLYEVKRLSVIREEQHKIEAGFRWNEGTQGWMRINNSNENSLFRAATEGNEFLLQAEIDNNRDINETNNYNETPLMIAIRNNHYAIVDILLNNNADTIGAIELASQPNVDQRIRSRISRAHSPVNMITGQNMFRNERDTRRRSNH